MPFPKITVPSVNKVKIAAIATCSLSLMISGYFAITALVAFSTLKADQFAVSRVEARQLIAPTVVTTEVPVVTADDVKAQVDTAIASHLPK